MLPQNLKLLTVLVSFTFFNNPGLCASVDDGFQAWLEGISIARGSSCALSDSVEDRAALVAFHGATDGANWTNNSNWLSNRPIRDWYGVVSDAEGQVVELILSRNQVSGQIPPELGDLTAMAGLYLRDNQLSGEIPTELGKLSNLTRLFLSNNQLSGCVPAELRDVASNDFEEIGLLFCETPQTLLKRYDADKNGAIDRSEMIAAINDFLFGVGYDASSKANMIKVINLYLFG